MGMFTDINFVNRIGLYVERFRWVQPSKVANCRCPICGDSPRNPRKARGFFFIHAGKFFYKCHKCSASFSLRKLIEQFYPALTEEYRLESFKEDKVWDAPKAIAEVPENKSILKEEPKSFSLADLPEAHEAVQYALQRKIPASRWDDIGYTENFAKMAIEASGEDKYRRLPKDRRIVFELRGEDGKLFGLQGRAIDPSSPMRYITIRFDEAHPKLFGLDSVNRTLPITVVEGPIDSLFIPNSIALCGGDVSMSLKRFVGCDVTVALDNEPYSADTVSRMRAAIDKGFKVAFWNLDTKFKDINDMVLKGGMKPELICEHIRKNSYKGGKAYATLLMWKKT